MKRLRIVLLLFVCCLVSFSPAQPLHAAQRPLSFRILEDSAQPGELVRLSVALENAAAAPAAFRLKVEYDVERFSFVKAEHSAQVRGDMVTNGAQNPVCSVYASPGGQAPVSGTIITYVFRVREECTPGAATFLVQADQLCDFSGAPCCGDWQEEVPVQIDRAPSGETALLGLIPSAGELEPAFSSGVYQYALQVGSTVDDVVFSLEAAADGTASASRHKLNRAGESTEITITVVSENGKNRAQYGVTVNRLEEPEPEEQRAFLTGLVPSVGELSPAFSPEIHQYTLPVDSNISDVTLAAQAGEGGAVTVNRHRLNRAGTSTELIISVLSQNGKTRAQYFVTVNRAQEPESEQQQALLLELVPSVGKLEPAFSPQVHDYSLRVASGVFDVVLAARAQDDGRITVNRHRLNRAGTSTELIVTVLSANGKTRAQYYVTVNRAQAGVSGGKASSSVGASPSSGSEAYVPKPPSSSSAAESLPSRAESLPPQGNRMPAFLLGALLAALCLGIVFLLLSRRRKK